MNGQEHNLRYLIASDFLTEFKGKIVLVKSDFNVPVHKGAVADDYRIREASTFIKKLVNCGAIPLLVTHLGRPKGFDEKLKLDVIADCVSDNIEKPVEIIRFDPQKEGYRGDQLNKKYIFDLVKNKVKIPMLDNVRFHPSEQKNNGELAKVLASIVDISVQNSFGTAHRKEDTSNFIHTLIPGLAGDLLHNEIEGHKEIKKPHSPYTVIVGGDKVSDSQNLIRRILWAEKTSHIINAANPDLMTSIGEKLVDYVLIGGHLMNAFIYAQIEMVSDYLLAKIHPEAARNIRGLRNQKFLEGYYPAKKELEEEIRLAKGLLRLYNNYQLVNQFSNKKDKFSLEDLVHGRRLIMPVDYSVLRDKEVKNLKLYELHQGDQILDIGEKTRSLYAYIIGRSETIVWNGSMGTDEEKYKKGTRSIIDAIHKNKKAIKERGGGTTNYMTADYEKEAGKQFDLGVKSTGGGATLLETVHDSPVTVCLRQSFNKLISGGYPSKFEYLKSSALIRYVLAK